MASVEAILELITTFLFIKLGLWAGETAQQLSALAVLAEEREVQFPAYTSDGLQCTITPVLGDLMPLFWPLRVQACACMWYTQHT